MTLSLSAVLIAKDEATDLAECLDSLKNLASEIVIVVSNDTTDDTADIARARGAMVLRRDFDDYAKQRQFGLDAATADWCLWIDPDERVTPALGAEIRAQLAHNTNAAAYRIPFEIHFLGRRMRWGGLGSEAHVRLFRRSSGRFSSDFIHERLEIEGVTSALSASMRHLPYRGLSDYLLKLDRYTTLAARKRFVAGRRFSPLHHLLLPWEFFARAVLKLGIMDGYPGVVWAGLAAFHSWLKYVKLHEMERAERT